MAGRNKLTEKQIRELAFTEEERRELDRARQMPFVYDEDCPPVTPEMAKKFRRGHHRHGSDNP